MCTCSKPKYDPAAIPPHRIAAGIKNMLKYSSGSSGLRNNWSIFVATENPTIEINLFVYLYVIVYLY